MQLLHFISVELLDATAAAILFTRVCHVIHNGESPHNAPAMGNGIELIRVRVV